LLETKRRGLAAATEVRNLKKTKDILKKILFLLITICVISSSLPINVFAALDLGDYNKFDWRVTNRLLPAARDMFPMHKKDNKGLTLSPSWIQEKHKRDGLLDINYLLTSYQQIIYKRVDSGRIGGEAIPDTSKPVRDADGNIAKDQKGNPIYEPKRDAAGNILTYDWEEGHDNYYEYEPFFTIEENPNNAGELIAVERFQAIVNSGGVIEKAVDQRVQGYGKPIPGGYNERKWAIWDYGSGVHPYRVPGILAPPQSSTISLRTKDSMYGNQVWGIVSKIPAKYPRYTLAAKPDSSTNQYHLPAYFDADHDLYNTWRWNNAYKLENGTAEEREYKGAKYGIQSTSTSNIYNVNDFDFELYKNVWGDPSSEYEYLRDPAVYRQFKKDASGNETQDLDKEYQTHLYFWPDYQKNSYDMNVLLKDVFGLTLGAGSGSYHWSGSKPGTLNGDFGKLNETYTNMIPKDTDGDTSPASGKAAGSTFAKWSNGETLYEIDAVYTYVCPIYDLVVTELGHLVVDYSDPNANVKFVSKGTSGGITTIDIRSNSNGYYTRITYENKDAPNPMPADLLAQGYTRNPGTGFLEKGGDPIIGFPEQRITKAGDSGFATPGTTGAAISDDEQNFIWSRGVNLADEIASFQEFMKDYFKKEDELALQEKYEYSIPDVEDMGGPLGDFIEGLSYASISNMISEIKLALQNLGLPDPFNNNWIPDAIKDLSYSLLVLYFLIELLSKIIDVSKITLDMVLGLLVKFFLCKILVDVAPDLCKTINDICLNVAAQVSGQFNVSGLNLSAERTILDTIFGGNTSSVMVAILTTIFGAVLTLTIFGVIKSWSYAIFFLVLPFLQFGLINGIIVIMIVMQKIILYIRMLEMTILTFFSPLAVPAFVCAETKHMAKKFIMSFAALCLQGAIIVVCCEIVDEIMLTAAAPGNLFDIVGNLVAGLMPAVLLTMLIGKSRQFANSILGT